MTETSDSILLLEIGCEELPDWMIRPALEYLSREITTLAAKEGLGNPVPDPEWLGTPRRLAYRARGFFPRQEDREVEVQGPRLEAAYDSEGKPTRALMGFAKAQGISPDQVRRVRSLKGDYVAAHRFVEGKPTCEVLSRALPAVLAGIPFGKTMRWGEGKFRFGRPVHWIVCLLGREIIRFEFAGIATGRTSRGVRFAGSPPVEIFEAGAYLEALEPERVLPDLTSRRERIARSLRDAVSRLGPELHLEELPGLLDSITGMVEYPVVSLGKFDTSFLDLPAPILATAMIHHQRFFPIRHDDGSLAPHYAAVLNCDPSPATVDRIRRGNEWVLRARLRDAKFFWEEDKKRPLENRLPDLEKVLFEATLGSYRKKISRTERLVRVLCDTLKRNGCRIDGEAAREAAILSKCDLTTLTVNEFPELQGLMGSLAAREEGKPEPVARAMEQQYRGGGDGQNRHRFLTPEGAVLAIADRFDTLVGFFLLGRVPSGSRDPYGLRRAATALVQAALDQDLSFSLEELTRWAQESYRKQGIHEPGAALDKLAPFIQDRLRYICQQGHGFRYDAVSAALAVGADDLRDAFHRAEALNGVRAHADFEALSLSFKRVRNILADQTLRPLRDSVLKAPEEKVLFTALQEVETETEPLLAERNYPEALRAMASLRPTLDTFFDKVLVMESDERLRSNRLALLARISTLFRRVGDIAEMVLEGEGAAEPAKKGRRG